MEQTTVKLLKKMTKLNGQDKSSRCGWLERPLAVYKSLTLRSKMMMEHQDSMLNTIGGTLSTLVEQAGLMGREIGEHNEYVATALLNDTSLRR